MRMPLSSVLSLAFLMGCGPDPVPAGVAPAPAEGVAATQRALSTYTLADQAFDDRAVWIKPSGFSCGDAGSGWMGVPLFPGSEPGLSDFCQLTSTGSPSLPTTGTAAYDRLAISTLSGVTSSRGSSGTPASFEEATYDQVDPIATFTATGGGGLPTAKARLTFLDTTPTAANPVTKTSFDNHGRSLAALAGAFTRDDGGTSLVDLESELAVSWIVTPSPSGPVFSQPTTSSGSLKGGSVGSQAGLASAIVEAVKDWEADTSAGPLVLNVSLGWHPYSDGSPSRSAAEEAVYAALEYASCKDALVLVAAGHEDTPIGRPGRTGAAYPAAWEAEDQPKAVRCNINFGGDDRPSTSSSYTPLVYAVGAVDVEQRPIGISRPSSMPRIAAPGLQLTVSPPSGGPLRPISGTSVATAVTSSAAALVRTIRPDLSAHDVMDVVYEGAYKPGSPDTAQVYNGSAGDAVRYASICGAVDEACSLPGGCLADMDSTQSCAAGPATPFEATIATLDPTAANMAEIDLFNGGGYGGANDNTAVCVAPHSYRYYSTHRFSYTNCPIQDKKAAKTLAIVQPMPTETLCPPCAIDFDLSAGFGTADLEMEVPVHELENPIITVNFDPASGLQPVHYPLYDMPSQAVAVDHVLVDMPPESGVVPTPSGMEQAISVTLDYTRHGFSYSEPLHVQFH